MFTSLQDIFKSFCYIILPITLLYTHLDGSQNEKCTIDLISSNSCFSKRNLRKNCMKVLYTKYCQKSFIKKENMKNKKMQTHLTEQCYFSNGIIKRNRSMIIFLKGNSIKLNYHKIKYSVNYFLKFCANDMRVY